MDRSKWRSRRTEHGATAPRISAATAGLRWSATVGRKKKTAAEPFTRGDTPLGFAVLDFWQWSASDLVGNALRGLVAEFLVARSMGVDNRIRNEWDVHDLTTSSGFRIEVKSAAYLQSWAQRGESPISFDVRETVAWDAHTNSFASENERRRQADLYVFALLAHRAKATLNPLDVSQWEFLLLETSVLNEHIGKKRRLSFARLVALQAARCTYAGLGRLIRDIEARALSAEIG